MRPARTGMLVAASAALAIVPVTLAAGAQPVAPTVVTAAASGTFGSGTTLNGIVNPNGLPTSYAFQRGPTAGYSHETALTSAGAGTIASAKTAALSSLNGGTAYHFRVLAITSAGTSVGSDGTFTHQRYPTKPVSSAHRHNGPGVERRASRRKGERDGQAERPGKRTTTSNTGPPAASAFRRFHGTAGPAPPRCR